MSCETNLIGFHFGELDAAERDGVEAHLPACSTCLREYLALKRAIETGDGEPRPSDVVRARLRQAVARKLGVAPAARRRWERPVAFAFAVSTMLAAVMATQKITSGPGAAPHAMPNDSTD